VEQRFGAEGAAALGFHAQQNTGAETRGSYSTQHLGSCGVHPDLVKSRLTLYELLLGRKGG
jgi:hypothetical protein